MQFVQAPIEVQDKAVFGELKAAIENGLSVRPEDFLHLVRRFGLRVRQFENVLKRHIFEQLAGAQPSRPCEELFGQLSLSDQGLIREFYLTRIEEVPVELRTKYARLYRYQ